MTPNYDDPQVFYDDPLVHYDAPTPAPPKMSTPRKTYPVNEVLGFLSGAKQMLTDKKTDMTAKGVDPTALIASLGTRHDDLNTKNIAQEALKTQLRIQTELVESEKTTAYNLASQACDMVLSAYSRVSEEAAEAMALRKSVRPAPRHNKTKPTPP